MVENLSLKVISIELFEIVAATGVAMVVDTFAAGFFFCTGEATLASLMAAFLVTFLGVTSFFSAAVEVSPAVFVANVLQFSEQI